jgi:large subunit ribosomal protein L31
MYPMAPAGNTPANPRARRVPSAASPRALQSVPALDIERLPRARPGLGAARPTHSRTAAMKKDTHPDYHEITVVMTDGTTYKTRSTWGKAGDTLKLDIDSRSHPVWTGVHRLVDSAGQLAKFNKRFQGIGLKS